MTTDDMASTSTEAYGMAYTVALEVLKDLMLDENGDSWIRLYAAEAILENSPEMTKGKNGSESGSADN